MMLFPQSIIAKTSPILTFSDVLYVAIFTLIAFIFMQPAANQRLTASMTFRPDVTGGNGCVVVFHNKQQ